MGAKKLLVFAENHEFNSFASTWNRVVGYSDPVKAEPDPDQGCQHGRDCRHVVCIGFTFDAHGAIDSIHCHRNLQLAGSPVDGTGSADRISWGWG